MTGIRTGTRHRAQYARARTPGIFLRPYPPWMVIWSIVGLYEPTLGYRRIVPFCQ